MAAWGCAEKPSTEQSSASAARTVSVAAASDLKFALDEVIRNYGQEHPDTTIKVTYGSSGNFYAQLSQGAPFDLYFSADVAYPRRLIEQGLADKESEFLYGVGQIVVWVPNDSLLDVEKLGIRALLDPATRKVAIANPQHAPYGRAAEAALKSLEVYDQVKERLVLGENIAQTAQFVESGAADVGIIALSLAVAPELREKGRYWLIPLDSYPTLEQGGVIMNRAADCEATASFRDFVIGARGREILSRYGFFLPGE
jgi:molybdate transport system substrate-binding protein